MKKKIKKYKQTFYVYIYTIVFLPAFYSIEVNEPFLQVISSKYIAICIALLICIILFNLIDFLKYLYKNK